LLRALRAATCFSPLDRLDEAEEGYLSVIELAPLFAPAHHNYGNLLHRAGPPARSHCGLSARAVDLQPDFVTAHSNLVYALNFSPDWAPDRIYGEHREWARCHAQALLGEIRPHPNSRDPDRTLRIRVRLAQFPGTRGRVLSGAYAAAPRSRTILDIPVFGRARARRAHRRGCAIMPTSGAISRALGMTPWRSASAAMP
jgi:hypothetical protein